MELHNWIMESYNFAAASSLALHTTYQHEKKKLYSARISPHDFYSFAFLFDLYLFCLSRGTLPMSFISKFAEHVWMILSTAGLFIIQCAIIKAKHLREWIFMSTNSIFHINFIEIIKSRKGFAQNVIFITTSHKFMIDEFCPEQEMWFVIAKSIEPYQLWSKCFLSCIAIWDRIAEN